MNIKQKLAMLAVPLALLGMVSCSRDEVESTQTPQAPKAEQITYVDLHIEATASMDLGSEVRATTKEGAIQMKYIDNTPLFNVLATERLEDSPYGPGDSVHLKANCVFKPLKPNSATELDDSRALYGTILFRRVIDPDNLPSLKDGKAVAVKIVSDGRVALKGNTSINPGEEWYVMGIVGGSEDAEGKKVEINGFTIAVENRGNFTRFDANPKGNGSVPFLSKWTKLKPVTEENKVESEQDMQFKFQGILFTIDLKNGTEYNLNPSLIQLQSTELVGRVAYDLSASNNIGDTEDKMKWENLENKDVTGRWYLRNLGFGDKYRLDPKSKAINGNFLYDVTESKKYPATVIFWVNTIETPAIKRTGFFISSKNTEAKPAWNEKIVDGKVFYETNTDTGTQYKYVLTSDDKLDGILGTHDNHFKLNNKYASDIQIAPGVANLCAKTIQHSLKRNQGKFIHLTLTVPERPVMPIETMAQNNLWGYKDGKTMDFVFFPGEDRNYAYQQKGTYAKQFAEYSEKNKSYWMLPSLNQWYGILMAGHNNDNAHNWNENAYNWIEGEGTGGDRGREEVGFGGENDLKTYYAVYGRPEKGNPNANKIYGLRFFTDPEHKKGSDLFSLTRYERTTYGGKPVLKIQTVWLGPEYAKLYEGMYPSLHGWIKEISMNDNEGEKSMFVKLRADFVTRYLLVEEAGSVTYAKQVPQGYNSKMVGYFYGPSSNFKDAKTAKAIAFKDNTLFTGPSKDLKYDFTDYTSSYYNNEAYVRPVRRNFTKFGYK